MVKWPHFVLLQKAPVSKIVNHEMSGITQKASYDDRRLFAVSDSLWFRSELVDTLYKTHDKLSLIITT